ncbi:PH domain-containing protein, partial [Streptomyces sp. UH6]|uniref:PH domain-containing protein n=1 Tax=Streptomyces sp. UH6 TaxID=2748379 RepID=UPI0015D4FFD8
MSTPSDHQPSPEPGREAGPVRVHRSNSAIAGGILLTLVFGALALDAIVNGAARTAWSALAVVLVVAPLVIAFTFRPAVFVDDDALRVRNPFRTVTLPWGAVAAFRSGYSHEVLDTAGKRYQLWALPVSLRARKKAQRVKARQDAVSPVAMSTDGVAAGIAAAPGRGDTDRVVDDLRELQERRAAA